jgi:hypothetical protein
VSAGSADRLEGRRPRARAARRQRPGASEELPGLGYGCHVLAGLGLRRADADPYLDFSKLTRDQAAALTEVTVEDFKDGRGEDARNVRKIRFKLADKRAALVDLGKHFGMFRDKIEHMGRDGGPIETREAPPPMTRAEVAKAVRKLIAGAEVDLGLPAGSGSDASRLKAIMTSGQPLPPDVYAAIYGRDGNG